MDGKTERGALSAPGTALSLSMVLTPQTRFPEKREAIGSTMGAGDEVPYSRGAGVPDMNSQNVKND